MKVHYGEHPYRAACGHRRKLVTRDRSKVTCGFCVHTQHYRRSWWAADRPRST